MRNVRVHLACCTNDPVAWCVSLSHSCTLLKNGLNGLRCCLACRLLVGGSKGKLYCVGVSVSPTAMWPYFGLLFYILVMYCRIVFCLLINLLK